MNNNYKLIRLCSALAYGREPQKPSGISAPRWSAMIKSAEKFLRMRALN